MNVPAIDRTIRQMCLEVESLSGQERDWRSLSEEQLLYEASICIFGSQTVFEIAVAAADRVRAAGLLKMPPVATIPHDYADRLVSLLSAPVSLETNGIRRQVLPRFRNRLAFLLSATVQTIHGSGSSLRAILSSATSGHHARELLVEKVAGFGPKQASLFLRRAGFCSELAVLDRHVLHYLRIARGLHLESHALSRLPTYARVENEFRRMATEFGHTIGCVDLATWITIRVAKREAML